MSESLARIRHHCPLCDWHLDVPDPDPFPTVTPEWLAAARAEHPQYADDPVFLALLAHNEPIEAEIRAHLETHTLLEWVQEVMRLRQNKPPATVYQVVIQGYQGPEEAELFSNRPAAEAYQAQLSLGSDLEEVAVLDQSPTRVKVHFYETWVLPDGVTMNPRPPRLHHAAHERWSHDLWPAAEQWTHPGSHTHIVRPTTEPLVCVLETYGFDQRATWQAHLDEEARLRGEASGEH